MDRRGVLDRSRILPGGEPARPVSPRDRAHELFAYQLEYGVIARLGWSNADDAVLCHQCDFAGCTNPTRLLLGTNRTNHNEYDLRRRNIVSPLADVRGPAGRARAFAGAIRIGIEQNDDATTIDQHIHAAEVAGRPLSLW